MSLKAMLVATVVATTTTVVAPAGAEPPGAVNGPRDALDQVATIIEGRVESISFSYDPQQGPRTIANFVDVVSHAGTPVARSLSLATLGGPLPDGKGLNVPELPKFDAGRTYVVFLTAADWFYSPVVADYAFRVEPAKDGERVVSQTGNPVTGFSEDLVSLGERSVELPVVDLLQGRTLAPDAAQVLATGRTKLAFVADVVRLYTSRKQQLSVAGGALPAAPKTFKAVPRADRVWNVAIPSGTANAAPMCVEMDTPMVCE